MIAFTGRRLALIATAAAVLAASTPATAAPIPVFSKSALAPQSDITDVRYRRRYGYGGGGAFAGAALGILALGAAAAIANGNGYYDEPTYYDPYYGPKAGYRVYSAPAYYPAYYPRRHYYGGYGHYYGGYGHQWRHSNRVGRN